VTTGTTIRHQGGAGLIQVIPKLGLGHPTEGDQALLGALAEDSHEAKFKVYIPHL
jgi:hypothetical protein